MKPIKLGTATALLVLGSQCARVDTMIGYPTRGSQRGIRPGAQDDFCTPSWFLT